MTSPNMFAEPTNPYALSQRDLDRLRTRVSKAEAEVKEAEDWSSKTRLEQHAKALTRELASAELARREEQRGDNARFDSRYVYAANLRGSQEFTPVVPYHEPPKKPKMHVAGNKAASGQANAVAWPQKMSERAALLAEAMKEIRRAGAA